ncbi:MAG TPA: Ig-like domain-containing protein [Candidatus Dormibacteraeota bacterium]|nr:Ig-like domain-containing protein [Candidatus Dormibacteraeota bacterium]
MKFSPYLAGLLLFSYLAGAQDFISDTDAPAGREWHGNRGISATTAQLMAHDQLRAGGANGRHVSPRFNGPPGNAGTDTNSSSAPTDLGSQTVSPTLNFTAATFNDCSGWPPDTMGAVGPTQFIIALNGRIRSFSKTTGAQDGGIDVNTDPFFSSVVTPGLNFTTDPRIRYDRLSGRWFVIMIDVPGQQGNQPNRVMIAVSDSGIISQSTVWTFFQFPGDATNFADYPTLGIDANALYIGANIFSTSSGSFVNTTVYVVRKSALLSGGPIVVTSFSGLISGHGFSKSGPYTPQGVDNYSPTATEGYFIGVDSSSLSTLQLRRVSNPGGTPTLSGNVSITVSSFAQPINVTVSGTSGTVDGLDRRLLGAHFRNGSIWTSHNVGVNSTGGTSSPDRNGVRWYQLNGIPTGQTPSVGQFGTVFQSGSTNLSLWMGSIMVSGQGHAAMGFTVAGPNHFLDAATTGRLVGDANGSMAAPTTYTASTSAYNPSDGSSPHRWGDYSYTSLDPSDDMTMWTVQEWCQSAGDGFALQVAQLLAPPPALPTNCSPSSLTQGVSSVTVVIKGLSTNGSGFFDPGTNFTKRLAAAINGGGVTVSSLTFNNPTNITAVLNIASNATAGGRTITVTNPDGQIATSFSNLLTIVTGSNPPSTNTPPVLAAIANRTIVVGTLLTFTNSATDTDSPPQTLTYSFGPGAATNATLNPTNGVFSWIPNQSQIGTNNLKIIVTDNGLPSLSATQAFAVTVLASNTPPVLAAISNRVIAVGMTLVFTNTASDTDSPPQTLTFSLGSGAAANATINPTNGVFSWSPNQSQIGTNAFKVIVADNGSPSLSATQSFSVAVLASNHPPVLAAISNRVMAVGMTLTFTNVATDTDSPPQVLTYSFGPGAVTNASLNATNGIFSWSPNQAQIGTNAFRVIVADNGLPSLSATQSFSVAVLASNHPPVLATISNRVIAVGMTLTFTNVATDTDSPPQTLTFTLDSGPTNATLNATNGVFSWIPNESQTGTNHFSISVHDNGLPPLSATNSFSVSVGLPPVLAVPGFSNGVVNLNWSSIPGAVYRVSSTTNLVEGPWVDIVPDVTTTDTTASLTTTNESPAAFYRVLLLP